MAPWPSEGSRRDKATQTLDDLLPALRDRAAAGLGEIEGDAVAARIEQNLFDVAEPLELLYGERLGGRAEPLVRTVLELAVDATLARPTRLRRIDRRREVDRRWFQRSRVI